MRAEMTVGLDLKKLEDLRIFNGYDTKELERRRSLETPTSSPEQEDNGDDSDYFQQPAEPGTKRSRSKGGEEKQKCGRPSNPVPRHKRESHIKAEYKRRDKIQKGFDSLMTMVPSLKESSASKESKSSMLFKSAEYCRRLKSEYGDVEHEMRALRQELESLGTEIHDLQERLPKQGAGVVDKETLQMDELYNAYVEEETKKNWKFWIFGFFMKPLYKSYRVAVTGTYNSLELSKLVIDWVKDAMSLSSLRQGFLDSLRKVSTRTDIMYHPELLEKEAATKPKMHCILTEEAGEDQDVVYRVTPAALTNTPKVIKTTPKTTPRHTPKVTPVPTPTPTPPRTPTSARRNKRRESYVSKGSRPNSPQESGIRVSKKSRSRSNSPQDGSTRIRRRPSNRSEKRHYSGDVEEQSPMMFSNAMPQFTFPQPAGLPAKRVSPLPLDKNIPYLDEMNIAFNNNATFSATPVISDLDTKLPMPIASYGIVPFVTSPVVTKPDDKLLTSFIGSLASFLETSQGNGLAGDQGGMSDASSTVFTCSDVNMSIDYQSLINDNAMAASIDNSTHSSQSGFIPIKHTGLITNNSIFSMDKSPLDPTEDSMLSVLTSTPYDFYPSSQSESLSVLHADQASLSLTPNTSTSLDTYHSSIGKYNDQASSSFTPNTSASLDTYHSSIGKYNDQASSSFTPNTSASLDTYHSSIGAGDVTVKQEGHNVFTNDEDSLIKMLSLDVLDVNSVMTFFGDDQSQAKHEKSSNC